MALKEKPIFDKVLDNTELGILEMRKLSDLVSILSRIELCPASPILDSSSLMSYFKSIMFRVYAT